MTVGASLRAKYDVVAREAAKFGTVGAVSTVIDIAVFNVMLNVTGSLQAKIVSTMVAMVNAFVLNRYWSFRHRERSHVGKESALFFGLNMIGLVIGLIPLWIAQNLGYDGKLAANVAAFGVGLPLGTLFRFWAYRKFVWLAPKAVETADDDGDAVAHVVLSDSHEAATHEPAKHDQATHDQAVDRPASDMVDSRRSA